MEAIDCLNGRRSVRKFTDAHIDRETVSKIVLAAQAAPSWKNMQPTRFTAMYGDAVAQVHKLFGEENSKLGDWNGSILSTTTLLVAVSAVKGKSGYNASGEPSTVYGDGYTFFDCGAAVQNFCLAAHAYGVGSVVLGHFDLEKLTALAEIPQDEELIVLIACGYPAEAPDARKRLDTDSVLRFLR